MVTRMGKLWRTEAWRVNMWRNRVGHDLRMILQCEPQVRRRRYLKMANTTLSDVDIVHGLSVVTLYD